MLGGWRNVMYLYGAVSLAVGLLWILFVKEPPRSDPADGYSGTVPIRRAVSDLLHIKALWLLGVTLLFRTGCIMGMTGYLPLYLRDQGWMPASADGALAAFYGVSTLCVVPLSFLSDRLGSRKAILFPALLVTLICFGLIPLVDGTPVWILMILSGIFMDGFMAVIVTLLLETEGIRPVHSGIALGLLFTISQIGAVISPPMGNSFASINPGLPFFFWAGLSLAGLLTLTPVKERAHF
jgi:predicted MFS family arabinose efflux permease